MVTLRRRNLGPIAVAPTGRPRRVSTWQTRIDGTTAAGYGGGIMLHSLSLPGLPNLLNRCHVPWDLEAVTTRGEEVPPRSVGVEPEGVRAMWRAVERFYRTGLHPALQLCVRRRGQVVLDRAIGHAAGNAPGDPPDAPKRLATTDTPFCIFSAAKAVTAMVVHLLDQRGVLHVNDPVTEYIPEFGCHGKERVTIEHVITHRAGIPNMPAAETHLDNLAHPERVVEILCDSEPTWAPGRRLAYHAITGGFILAEVVRRATGRDIRAVLRDEILAPLGFRWMSYGVAPEDVPLVAMNAFTGPRPLPPMATLARRALGVDFVDVATLANDPRWLATIVPAANIMTSAKELSRFYQLLLNEGELDGVRVYEPRTIRRATSEQSYLEFDLTLGIPTRYSAGFILGQFPFYGPDTPYAFGHLGFINIVAWADPERNVAAALTNSGKPFFFPEALFLYDVMRQVTLACPKEPA